MASIREIKRRKISITSTQQITKAMKLVATAKLQRAKVQAEATRPYFLNIHQTISSILSQCVGVSHPFLEDREGNRNLYVVITSNRGLAGGYNSNVGKMVINHLEGGQEGKIIAVGKKVQSTFESVTWISCRLIMKFWMIRITVMLLGSARKSSTCICPMRLTMCMSLIPISSPHWFRSLR